MRELNLLPSARRRLLTVQISLNAGRRAVQGLILSLSVLTVGGVATLAILWALLLTSSQSTSVSLEQSVEEYRLERERVAKKNLVLRTMSSLSKDQVVWTELLPDLFEAVSTGVVIEKVGGEIGQRRQLSFSGRAASRSTVIIATDRLEELPWVSTVLAPHSNLIERVSPAYSFSLLVGEENNP